MRIGIDVRYLSHGLVGGVHTYIKQLVLALIEVGTQHQFFLYADTKRPFELTNLPAHVTVRYLPWRNPLSSVQHDLFMRYQIAKDRVDIAHYPANYGLATPGARTVVTLHDALTIMPLRETLFSPGSPRTVRRMAMTGYLYAFSRRMLGQADLILTVSEHAKRDILRFCSVAPGQIVAIPHAPTPGLQRVIDPLHLADVRQRLAIHKQFILADGLKNPGVIIRAWRRLPAELRDQYQVVFFSRRPDPLAVLREAAAQGEVKLLINPGRDDLIALYSMARVFVFPSWFEGFGIPILEAMTCGAPVIASNRTAIPEVVGDAGLIVDAEDDLTLASQLTRLLTDPDEARMLQERGFARAAQYSWQATAQRTLEAYTRALSQPRQSRSGRPVHV